MRRRPWRPDAPAWTRRCGLSPTRQAVSDPATDVGRGLTELVDLAPPGIDELLGVLSVLEARQTYDAVVVDTAPTGHALRLLEMPALAREWVQALLRVLLKYRQIVRPGPLAEDLVELSRQIGALQELLRDRAATHFIAVARAAELPRLETARLLARLRRLRLPTPVVVVNALAANPGACPRCRADLRAERREMVRFGRLCRQSPLRYHPRAARRAAAARHRRAGRVGADLDRMKPTGTYVYCLVAAARRPRATRTPGLAGAGPVRLVEQGSTARGRLKKWLVVSDVPLDRYGESAINAKLSDLDWVSRAAVAHEAVVESFIGAAALVPMKLFTIFADDARAAARLGAQHDRINAALERVRGRVELGVRVALDRQRPQPRGRRARIQASRTWPGRKRSGIARRSSPSTRARWSAICTTIFPLSRPRRCVEAPPSFPSRADRFCSTRRFSCRARARIDFDAPSRAGRRISPPAAIA